MYVVALPNGKYKFCEQYVDNLTNKRREVSVTLNKDNRVTRSNAQKVLLSKISKKQHNPDKNITSITFGKLMEECERIFKKQMRNSSRDNMLAQHKVLINEIGKDALVNKITTVFLNKMMENLMFGAQDRSEDYCNRLKTRLNKMFEFAIEHGYLNNNPAEKLKIKYKPKHEGKIADFFLEQNELEQVMEFLKLKNYRYYLLCQWLYLNGLRFAEGAGMLKSDVILSDNRNYCIVDGNLDYHGNKISDQGKTRETKTKAGTREVDINSRAIEIYEEACTLSANSDFIFTTKNGTPLQPTAINSFLRNNKEKMGIPKDKRISTHIFRHTHISKLAELEVPLYVIQRRVGHSSSKITEKIYLHITEKMKEKTRNLLEFL